MYVDLKVSRLVHFSEPGDGEAFKEAFTRLGYSKQTNSHEEVIHHLIEMKFAYLLVQGSCFAVPFSLSPLLSHLQCCLLMFSHISLSSQFTVHKTVVGSSQLRIFITCFTLEEWLYRPKKIDAWHQTFSRSLCRGAVWGRDYLWFQCHIVNQA